MSGPPSGGEGAARARDVPEESLMITGDENIVDIDFIVFWRISEASAFLFNLQNPEQTVKMAAESVMRDIIGQSKIQEALTGGREAIELQTQTELQGLMNEYKAGIEIRQIQLLAVDPPSQVIDAFNEVHAPPGWRTRPRTRPKRTATTWCRGRAVRRRRCAGGRSLSRRGG